MTPVSRLPPPLQVLDGAATARALPWSLLMEEIAQVCREHREGRLTCPPRQVLPLAQDGVLLVMPCLSDSLSITKLVSVHPLNAALGLPTIAGEVVAMDSRTGQRLAVLDGPTLTARRTAAVSLLALQHLQRAAPRRVLVVGGGVQARAHVQAMQALHPQASIHVQGHQEVPAFVAELGVEALVPEAQTRHEWDVIVCATTSRVPVLRPGVGEGAVVIGVGAFREDMVELPPELLRSAQVWVDDPVGAQAEAGDLMAAGLFQPQDALDDLVLGQRPIDDRRTRVFKSVGCARWDLAAARVAVRR
ncbi:delta(1)-pyrroline-2-carboxylate reductase family protein [Roseateles amylovorans]|uniref:Delta(1)-pyrroline-2-carboxylate reductase family protein n=1 Tax=Roseateles amylovorans TaxID=2978473 RepID=A0ABY6AY92_9BURK|nr:delta(1)-pyrroline-2-carboxylate reductase family protein [Roseateles amylovorans]UXH77263.1 delta(1)-pyrroline-2-carboxylate reductase family protein [Roseateles amylovorans]